MSLCSYVKMNTLHFAFSIKTRQIVIFSKISLVVRKICLSLQRILCIRVRFPACPRVDGHVNNIDGTRPEGSCTPSLERTFSNVTVCDDKSCKFESRNSGDATESVYVGDSFLRPLLPYII